MDFRLLPPRIAFFQPAASRVGTPRLLTILLLSTLVFPGGCMMSAAEHSNSLHSAKEREMTVGTVQREIRRGMSQTQVVEALGSPNIVTRDQAGSETWVYDKIATEASYSSDRGAVSGAGGGGGTPGGGLLLGGLFGSYNRSAGAAASTQKTLTVVIKFSARGEVSDFSYHASKF